MHGFLLRSRGWAAFFYFKALNQIIFLFLDFDAYLDFATQNATQKKKGYRF